MRLRTSICVDSDLLTMTSISASSGRWSRASKSLLMDARILE